MMQLQKVESGLIATIGYDAEKQELHVEFHKSKKQTANPVYSYTPFLPCRWAEFQSSQKSDTNPTGSVGRYFIANIKSDTALKVVRVVENESPKELEQK
jgi:hypothetical protein